MSGGWEIGDLALCVDIDFHLCGSKFHLPRDLSIGQTFRVDGVVPADCGNCLGLILEGGLSVIARRFRKIRPDEHEPCEEEFVTLIKRSKVPEHAELREWVRARGEVK